MIRTLTTLITLFCCSFAMAQTQPIRNPAISGTGSIISGATLTNAGTFTNSGTLNGAGAFNLSSGTVTLPATVSGGLSSFQALDSDLTAIAALTTTATGRSLLAAADAPALRTILGLGTLATQNGTITDYLTIATAASTYQPLATGLTQLGGISGAQGDIIYHNGSSWVRLGAGTSGQALKTQGAGANPIWATVAGSVAADAIFDAAGDLAVGTGPDTAARLAIGSNGQVLQSNGTTAVWATPASGISGLTSGRVTFATAATTIGDDAGFTYDSGTDTLTAANIVGSTGVVIGAGSAITSSGAGGALGALAFTVPAANVEAWLADPTSAKLATAVTNETGSGALVFGTSPTFTTSINSGTSFTAFAGATTLLTIGGTGATATVTIPGTEAATGTIGVGALSVAGGLYAASDAWFDGFVKVGRGAFKTATSTAVGAQALDSNSSGASNTAIGLDALTSSISGDSNTAIGAYSANELTTGLNNTFVGYAAGNDLTTGDQNIMVGFNSTVAGGDDNNSIVIGYDVVGEGSNTTVIGNSSTTAAHIYGALTVPSIASAGIISAGTWNGTAITDAYVSDTLTASLFVGSGSTTNAIDLATAEVAGTLPFANGGTGEGTAPLDPYKHELLGAYSTARRLLTGYDAKTIFRVRESAGNLEADVPVTSSGDTTSVMTSLVGSNSGYIKSFRNQLSVPGAWPEFYNATTTTQMRTIDAGTQDTINSKTAMFNAKDATRTLACTSTTAGNSWAAIVVCRYTGDASTQAIAAGNGTYYLAFHNSNGKMYLAAAGTLGTTLFSYDNGHANAHWAKFENLVQVWAVTVKDGKQEMYINGWKAGATTAAGNYPLALTNFGYSGTSNITWKGQLAELVLFSSADAAGFIPAMQSMCSYYAAKPLVVLAGDSLTTGSGATGSPLQTYGMQLHDTSDYILHMVATIGHTADQVTTALNGTNNTNYSPRYSGDTIKNATVCWAGVNDLINGDSVATLQSDLTALWAQQRAAGFKVVACTLIGCIDNGSLVQQDLIDINAWIRTQTSSYDALADLGANANIGVGQHLDASYFHTDNIHLDSTGYGVAAGLIKTALDAIYP